MNRSEQQAMEEAADKYINASWDDDRTSFINGWQKARDYYSGLAGEFDENEAKRYAKEICNNNPSMCFDWPSIVNGARWQHSLLAPQIVALQAEVERLGKANVTAESLCIDLQAQLAEKDAEIARLREALEDILSMMNNLEDPNSRLSDIDKLSEIDEIARQALGKGEG